MSDNKPLLWTLGGAAFAFVAVVFYWIFALTLSDRMRSDKITPQRTAEFIHAVLEANRNNYTDNVVVKLQRDGIEAHEHWRDERGVPLPAQFLLESGRLVALKDLNLSFRLASLTPIYVWNGANSDLERQGLTAVQKNPENPFFGTIKKGDVRLFQAIYSDKAISQACVDCHNSHPNSPRRDFQLNDVMGGIIISFPIDQ
ncbi:hypothetical protein W02_34050 [Nitrospira sp. KM1]|uniref:Tll0287-like domain-containing protein n=1 Tax=Nitrospira sp. KM1 TaxID=1936990 RepID=UPI0013A7A7F1|nr:DUF3365 domain-containing protein [Nitrospira sp. KM1]BCA56265.1 hypothetical protein W02_34050 [Nitrospira sp. KM1]